MSFDRESHSRPVRPVRKLCAYVTVILAMCLSTQPARAQEETDTHVQYLHASAGLAQNAAFQFSDFQSYWQATQASGVVVLPLSLHAGDRLLRVEVFLENTVFVPQTATVVRKEMVGVTATFLVTGSSPATTGNHTLVLDTEEVIDGDRQWYVRVNMGNMPGNRVRGARVTYDRPGVSQ